MPQRLALTGKVDYTVPAPAASARIGGVDFHVRYFPLADLCGNVSFRPDD
jgi:hypothetical protein